MPNINSNILITFASNFLAGCCIELEILSRIIEKQCTNTLLNGLRKVICRTMKAFTDHKSIALFYILTSVCKYIFTSHTYTLICNVVVTILFYLYFMVTDFKVSYK